MNEGHGISICQSVKMEMQEEKVFKYTHITINQKSFPKQLS